MYNNVLRCPSPKDELWLLRGRGCPRWSREFFSGLGERLASPVGRTWVRSPSYCRRTQKKNPPSPVPPPPPLVYGWWYWNSVGGFVWRWFPPIQYMGALWLLSWDPHGGRRVELHPQGCWFGFGHLAGDDASFTCQLGSSSGCPYTVFLRGHGW